VLDKPIFVCYTVYTMREQRNIMEIDVYTHTALALATMGACYAWGRYLTRMEILSDIIGAMLDRLEADGFVETRLDKDGEKSLIPISEIKSEKSEISA